MGVKFLAQGEESRNWASNLQPCDYQADALATSAKVFICPDERNKLLRTVHACQYPRDPPIFPIYGWMHTVEVHDFLATITPTYLKLTNEQLDQCIQGIVATL